MAKERDFQAKLIKEIMTRFPGALAFKVETYIQGFPDLLVLYGKHWAALECKRGARAAHRPNQDYWVAFLNKMSFAAFISPENKEEVLHDLQRSFKTRRTARIPRSKQVPLAQLKRRKAS